MDEQQLTIGLRCRDSAAIQELVNSYGHRLLRSAFLLCGNEADAQDLAQDTFLQAFQSGHRFRGGSSIYTWLHAILLNLTRHYHRDRKRLICNDELARKDRPLPREERPHQLDANMAASALTDALQRISEPHREVLILRFYEDMKIHEIAAHLRTSKGTVKSRLHYAIAQMQKLLPDELNLFGAPGTKETERR
jgi:RNA polymerase sigma-70 factor, ECF subfamily